MRVIRLTDLTERSLKNFYNRFWSKVPHRPVDGCWLWVGGVGKKGYGRISISINNDTIYLNSNRAAWLLAFGELPSLFVCHTCDVRRCVRLEHLFTGTHKDNVNDAVLKNRYPFGENNGNAKLTNEQASQVLLTYPTSSDSIAQIAKKLNISRYSVRAILRGETFIKLRKSLNLPSGTIKKYL